MEIIYEYIENKDDSYDRMDIFVNGIKLCLYLEVEPYNQYYRLFSEDNDKCLEHYDSHKKLENNIKKDILKYYK